LRPAGQRRGEKSGSGSADQRGHDHRGIDRQERGTGILVLRQPLQAGGGAHADEGGGVAEARILAQLLRDLQDADGRRNAGPAEKRGAHLPSVHDAGAGSTLRGLPATRLYNAVRRR